MRSTTAMNDSPQANDPPQANGDETTPRPLSSARRLVRVLAGLTLFLALGFGLYAASPWLLPVSIVEGPMIQQARTDGVTVVWFTSREAPCELIVQTPEGPRSIESRSAGRRHVAAVESLAPASRYAYSIRGEGNTLTPDGTAFHTAKPPGEVFSFIAFGDSGRATREQYILGAEMSRQPVDFIVHTGDLIYPDGKRRDYQKKFFRPYRELLSRVAFWPTLGNHDVDKDHDGQPLLDVFELPHNGPPGLAPERNYWFDYAGARFVAIDSNVKPEVLRDRIAPWVRQTLSAPGPRWKFAVFHHPPYTTAKHKPDQSVQQFLAPVFEETGVDIVLSGHDHLYERTLPLRGGQPADDGRGVVYVVSGAGGASLYKLKPPAERPPIFAKLDDSVYSYSLVRVEPDVLTFQQIALGGKVIDEWQLRKPAPAP